MRGASYLQILLLLVLGAAGTQGRKSAHTSLPGPRSSANPHRPCSFCRLRAAPRVQWDRRGPGCTGRRVAMAGKHPASWSTRVREVAHRPPVGADSSALLPQVSAHRGPRRGVQGRQGPRRTGRGLAEALGSRRAGGGRGPGAGSSLPLLSYRRALPVEYRVRLGALHLGPTSPCTLSVPLRRVLLLLDYSEDGARGDLALLQLCRPVPLSARVQPVCLPVPGDRPPPGTPC
nr:serine protease 33 isoform X2 [Macaca nemestrina]